MQNTTLQLTRFFFVLLAGFLLVITTFTINFDWPSDIAYIDRFIYLNRYFTDFFQAAALIMLLCGFGKIGRIIALIIAVLFSLIYFIQSQSFATIGKYLPSVALENADHADFLNVDNLVFNAFVWIVFALIIYRLAKHQLSRSNWKGSLVFALVLVLISVLIKNDKDWLSEEAIQARFDFYNTGRAGVKHKSPAGELFETYGEYLAYLQKQEFIIDRPNELSKEAADYIYDNVSYFGKQNPDYPLMRKLVFSTPSFLVDDDKTSEQPDSKRKNIIILFAEGISARLMQPYSNYFPKLTPNIEEFSKSTIQVDNYFSHTFATYRGLGGQLCSLFPVGRLYPKIDYYCLGHALRDNNYHTRFMVSQSLARTDLDKIFRRAGIQHVDGSKNVIELTSYEKENASTVPDRVLVDALIERLKQEEQKKDDASPFMIGLYNFETHTGIRLYEQSTSYTGTPEQPREPNYVLDTFHNFDKVFGTFWNYFKQSSHFKDTIVVLTSDHATFPGKDYVRLVKGQPKFAGIFIDQIPMLIYHPDVSEPITINAKSSTSIDFAPTMLNLLGIEGINAPFLGDSIFAQEQNRHLVDLGGTVERIWFTNPQRTLWGHVSEANLEKVRKQNPEKVLRWEFLKYVESLERSNRLWDKSAQ